MADSFVQLATDGSGKKVDTRTESSNSEHRQVFVLGDPSTNAGVAPVDATKGLSVNLADSDANTNAFLVDGSAVTQPVSAASLPLPTGASTAAKQPALGTAGTASTDVITVQGIASMTALTVAGTVTANAGTNLNTSTLALEAGGNLAGAATSLAIMDDWDETDRAKVNPIAGQAGVQGASGTVTALTQRVVLATDVALPAGTNGIGKLTANSGVDIGDVDITSIAAGNNNIGDVDIASGTLTTLTTLTGGGIAHDSADSGNPHKVGFKAYSPDGTTPGTAVAEGDRSDAKADLDGRLYVNREHPVSWSYHLNTSTAQTDTEVKADPGDGFQVVITDIVFTADGTAAINLFFEEGASKILGPFYLPASATGMKVSFQTGKRVTASTAVTLTTSASHAHSVEVLGYVQAV